ncbi:MAG: hypothetical protein ABI592_13880 [Acidobacteriota bacterium]
MALITLGLAAALLAVPAAAAPDADRVEIRPGSTVELASAATGARLLVEKDVFVRALGPFDRSSRLKTDRDVSEAEYLAFVARQTREWSASEKAVLRPMLLAFREKTSALAMRMPPTVYLLKTTGLEEGMAAYCRGAAVVLPAKLVAGDPKQLQSVLFHELFHIFSRHNPQSRQALYRIVGFQTCPQIPYPEALASRRITNPDAPVLDAVIRVKSGAETVTATPILFSKTERYDAKQGGEFFESLVFRLLVVEESGGLFRAAADAAGQPRLLDPAALPDYREQVGRNTDYLIHPEEILADNFVLLVLPSAGPPPSPRILEELRAVLAK